MNEKWQHRFTETNGIRMHYVEQGEGFPVLLIHSVFELWYSWRFQIPALANAGFHAIAPDLRGYGETDKPEGIEAYDIHHQVGDLVGLLDALELKRAVVVGHGVGGTLLWQMALMHPERVERAISLNTTFRGHSEIPPTEALKKSPDGRFNYIFGFLKTEKSPPGVKPNIEPWLEKMKELRKGIVKNLSFLTEAEITPNLEIWLETTMRSMAKNPSFLTKEEFKVYYDAFRKGGVTKPLNFYRNVDHNWETTSHLKGNKITMPALMICAENDPVLKPEMADGMENHCLNLTKRLIKNCGHWTQQEQPEEVNRLIIEFLDDLKISSWFVI